MYRSIDIGGRQYKGINHRSTTFPGQFFLSGILCIFSGREVKMLSLITVLITMFLPSMGFQLPEPEPVSNMSLYEVMAQGDRSGAQRNGQYHRGAALKPALGSTRRFPLKGAADGSLGGSHLSSQPVLPCQQGWNPFPGALPLRT